MNLEEFNPKQDFNEYEQRDQQKIKDECLGRLNKTKTHKHIIQLEK